MKIKKIGVLTIVAMGAGAALLIGCRAAPSTREEVALASPRVTTLEEARKQAPFQILIPQDLPQGYELKEVGLVTRLAQGGREAIGMPRQVSGVSLLYSKDGSTDVLLIEQSLGDIAEGYEVGGARKIASLNVQGLYLDVWRGANALGKEVFTVMGGDVSRGVLFHMASFLSEYETLRTAASFR